ncbi:MAG: glycogen debranching N-terminal domain-containing protein [Chloroflexota bacterium]
MLDRSVLKENQMFLVTDPSGDVRSGNVDGQGLYWRDTRFLSIFELKINGEYPQLLSTSGEHNFMTNLQFANPQLIDSMGVPVAARTVSIRRNRFLHNGLHERLGFFNYNTHVVTLDVVLRIGSDFRDMFDVRGYLRRTEFGEILKPVTAAGELIFGYRGLDATERETVVRFDRESTGRTTHTPARIQESQRELPGISGTGDPRMDTIVDPAWADVHFRIEIPPAQYRVITTLIEPRIKDDAVERPDSRGLSLDQEFLLIRDSYTVWADSSTSIRTDNEMLNAVIRRSSSDLRLLSDQVPDGYLPSAGIPWFSVPFGRDSLITSLQALPLNPNIAYATLRFLARYQGTRVDDWRDEEPGKILHEIRLGEVAKLGKVPHTPYYGSVDSTPLFLITLSEFIRWTGDLDFGRAMLPHVEAALHWIDNYGDLDGDGFLEYRSRSDTGIRNQGWKDSHDSIALRDGRLVEPPIALSEVQGYAYDAKVRMAELFTLLGQPERGLALQNQAERLQRIYTEQFWMEDEGFYAMALGPEKEQVRSIGSNVGHNLWSGIIPEERQEVVGRRIMSEDLRCGWGIRTLSSHEPHFNPMSYHNGSVWPHDNSLIIAGLKRANLDREAAIVAGELIDAAVRFPSYRLPEVYCGFARDRRYFSMPAQYPVSCSPQAWAAASVFLMLRTLIGLEVNAPARRLTLRPCLPAGLHVVELKNLRVAGGSIDIRVEQRGDRVEVETSAHPGFEVIVMESRGREPAFAQP